MKNATQINQQSIYKNAHKSFRRRKNKIIFTVQEQNRNGRQD